MYLHIGQNVVVPEADVIGIFDLDNTTNSHITRQFLSFAENNGYVESVSDELPNSFVVCSKEAPAWRTSWPRHGKAGISNTGGIRKTGSISNTINSKTGNNNTSNNNTGNKKAGRDMAMPDDTRVYLSQLSTHTLLKRSESARII